MDKNKLEKSKLKLDKAIEEFEKAEKKLPENKKKQKKINKELRKEEKKQSNFIQEPKQQEEKTQSDLYQEPVQGKRKQSNFTQEPKQQEEKTQSDLYQEPVQGKRKQSNFTQEPKQQEEKTQSKLYQEPKQQEEKTQSKLYQEPKKQDINQSKLYQEPKKQDITQSKLYQEPKKQDINQSKLYQEPKQQDINQSKLHQEPKHYIKIDNLSFEEPNVINSGKKEKLLKESTFKSKLKENRGEASEEINTLISKQNEANKKYRNFINHKFKPETIQEYYKKHAILIQLEEKNKYNLRVNTSFKELPKPFIIKLRPREEVPILKNFKTVKSDSKLEISEFKEEVPVLKKIKTTEDILEPKTSNLKDTSNLKNTSKLNFKEELKSINIDDSYNIATNNSNNSKNNLKNIATKPINFLSSKAKSQAHKKVEELEENDTGLEAVHRTEKSIEKTYSLTKKAYQHHKNKPYVRVAKAQEKLKKAEINYSYQKYLYDNKFHFQKSNNNNIINSVSNIRQKQAIKKRYAKLYRKKYANYNKYIGGTSNNLITKVTQKVIYIVQKDPKIFIIIIFALFLMMIIGGVVSASILTGQAVIQAFLTTSYASSTEAMLETYENYKALENELKEIIENIEDDYPDFDEYVYNIDNLGHNPHELTSYLSVIFKSYDAELVKAELENLFKLQYTLTITESVELRYDDNGVPYQAKILTVELINKPIKDIAFEVFTDEEYELFLNYLENKGNLPTLFDDIYSEDTNQDGTYEVPADHLTDQEFAELLAEAEKYIGYPYVWGGSSPDTSFDCSGFISWVYDIPRTTAQGIYNQCTVVSSDEVKPGDLVFFTGTYNSVGDVSHIGMYVGNGMMLHCGDPIGYASLSSSYWSSHFYDFARLN